MQPYQSSSQKSLKKKHKKTARIEPDSLKIYQSSQKVLFDAINLSKDLNAGKLTFSYGGRPVRATNSDIIRVISEWPQNDSLSLTIRNIILSTIVSLERSSPSSGYAFLEMVGKSQRRNLNTRATTQDILSLVRKNIGNGICKEIVSHILQDVSINPTVEFVLSQEKTKFVVTSMVSLDVA